MKLRIAALALVSMTAALPLHAQDAESDGIEARLAACDKFTEPDERLACFNAVARSLKKATAETVEQPPVTPAAKPEVSGIPAAVPKTETELPKSGTDDFGRDSMKPDRDEKERKRDESSQAVIAGVRQHHDRRFSVELDNGQVWRETEGSRVGVPKVGRAVQITKGSLGGYRMKIDGISKTAWVRRTK